jgi:hypothetical protein
VAVPVIWFQVVNWVSISRRYSSADSRWRWGQKCEDIPENAEGNRCAGPGRELPSTNQTAGTSEEEIPIPGGGAQRFLSAFSGISPHFRSRRHRITAAQHRHEISTRFTIGNEIVGLPTVA